MRTRNPDGGFPTLSDGLPPAKPENPMRQALKTNDQRAWTPTSPMLLCAGNADPAVLYLNTELMQNYWSSATTVTVLDIDSAVASGDPYEARRRIRRGEGIGRAQRRRHRGAAELSRGARGAVLPERRQVSSSTGSNKMTPSVAGYSNLHPTPTKNSS